MYPDGWPGQKRLAAPSTAKALPQHEPTVEEQWENVCALKQMQPDLWKLYMAGGAGVDLWREISNRLLATNPRLHALTRARARKSFRRELGGLLTMPWQRFRGKSVEELQEQYGNRLGNNFPSRRHHWKMALFEIGHKVMEAADESV